MIKELEPGEKLGIPFSGSHTARRIKALWAAYGGGYPFCRFYQSDRGETACLFNASLLLAGEFSGGRADWEEWLEFIRFYSPQTAEVPPAFSGAAAFGMEQAGYQGIERVFFQLQPGPQEGLEEMEVDEPPSLDQVFQILKQGFDLGGAEAYPLWLTDASHQTRRGVQRFYLWKESTACRLYLEDGIAFFSQIATAPASRGQGQARKLLYWLERQCRSEGLEARLAARLERVSFYTELQFLPIERDVFWERQADLK